MIQFLKKKKVSRLIVKLKISHLFYRTKGLFIAIRIVTIIIRDIIVLIENENMNKITIILLKKIKGYIENEYKPDFIIEIIRKITIRIRNKIWGNL